MDKVKKKFYEAMEDVLLELVLDDYDRKRYRMLLCNSHIKKTFREKIFKSL